MSMSASVDGHNVVLIFGCWKFCNHIRQYYFHPEGEFASRNIASAMREGPHPGSGEVAVMGGDDA